MHLLHYLILLAVVPPVTPPPGNHLNYPLHRLGILIILYLTNWFILSEVVSKSPDGEKSRT